MKCRLSALNKLCGAFDLTEQQEEAQEEGVGRVGGKRWAEEGREGGGNRTEEDVSIS